VAPKSVREIVVDERRRTSLAKVGRKSDSRYLVEEFADGSLLLVPAVTISTLELAVLRNEALRESLIRAKDAGPEEFEYLGSFAQYADDDEEALHEVAGVEGGEVGRF